MDRALRQLGFAPIGQSGSHVRYRHADGRAVTVPRHDRKAVAPGLLRKIIRDVGVSVQDFIDLT
ncbi:MAG: type II toxin-antitoxin system HicA family toxin [Candidatus Thermoplasmatota archaeon]